MATFEAKTQFELREIQPEQQEAIRFFFEGNNVLVNLPTGFGKSLITYASPLPRAHLLRKSPVSEREPLNCLLGLRK